jgi:hypothetical protein
MRAAIFPSNNFISKIIQRCGDFVTKSFKLSEDKIHRVHVKEKMHLRFCKENGYDKNWYEDWFELLVDLSQSTGLPTFQ